MSLVESGRKASPVTAPLWPVFRLNKKKLDTRSLLSLSLSLFLNTCLVFFLISPCFLLSFSISLPFLFTIFLVSLFVLSWPRNTRKSWKAWLTAPTFPTSYKAYNACGDVDTHFNLLYLNYSVWPRAHLHLISFIDSRDVATQPLVIYLVGFHCLLRCGYTPSYHLVGFSLYPIHIKSVTDPSQFFGPHLFQFFCVLKAPIYGKGFERVVTVSPPFKTLLPVREGKGGIP